MVLSLPGNQYPGEWQSDSVVIVVSDSGGGGGPGTQTVNSDLLTWSLLGKAQPVPYLAAPWREAAPQLSPDGTLLALRSWESGSSEIWIRSFPKPEGKWRVSVDGGQDPQWSPDGSLLYFWRTAAGPDTLFAARIVRRPSVVVRAPERVLEMDHLGFDLHPDGKRFIVGLNPASATPAVTTASSPAVGSVAGAPGTAAPAAPAPVDRYSVVLNWFTELKARLGKTP